MMHSESHFIVSGGAGFLGSHIVTELVRAGSRCTIVDDLSTGREQNLHPEATFVNPVRCEDVAESLIPAGATVIHAASRPNCNASVYAPVADVMTNYVSGTKFLATCLRAKIRRFVFVSSMSVYGAGNEPPFVESMAPLPEDPYAVNKYALEQVVKTLCRHHGVEYVILRPQYVFGRGQRPDLGYRNVIAKWIRCALTGDPFPVIGGLDLQRAFSPVSLIARAVVQAAAEPKTSGEILNLGSRRLRTLGEVGQLICDQVGVPFVPDFRVAPPTLRKVSYGSVELASKLLRVEEFEAEFEDNLSELITELRDCPEYKAPPPFVPELKVEEFWNIYNSKLQS